MKGVEQKKKAKTEKNVKKERKEKEGKKETGPAAESNVRKVAQMLGY